MSQPLLKKIILSPDQIRVVDSLMVGVGSCRFCDTEMARSDTRAMLAQPKSFRAKEPGTMEIIGLCYDCHAHIAKAIAECKLRKKVVNG